ncbi:MAG: hypothetical protein ACOY0T_37410 [Myxococcota bacterium]
MTNRALFDVDHDGRDQGFVATPSAVHQFTLRSPGLGVFSWQLQVYDANAYDPSLPILGNPPRKSKGTPDLTLIGDTSGSMVSATSVSAPISVHMPASGAHSWIVRSVVNGGMSGSPPRPDPNLIHERIVALVPNGRRKPIVSELRQFEDDSWAGAIADLIERGEGGGGGGTGSGIAAGAFAGDIATWNPPLAAYEPLGALALLGSQNNWSMMGRAGPTVFRLLLQYLYDSLSGASQVQLTSSDIALIALGAEYADLQGGVGFSGTFDAATLVGTQNDLNITGMPSAFALRLGGFNGDITVTGIAGGRAGRVHLLSNVSELYKIHLLINSGASQAQNRFLLPRGSNLTLYPLENVLIWYDPDASRWRAVSLTGAGGGSGSVTLAAALMEGNETLGRNIVVTQGDAILGQGAPVGTNEDGHDLVLSGGAGDGTGAYGNVSVDGCRIRNVGDAVEDWDAISKAYLDEALVPVPEPFANGDLLVATGGPGALAWARLPVGSTQQRLTVSGGSPAWTSSQNVSRFTTNNAPVGLWDFNGDLTDRSGNGYTLTREDGGTPRFIDVLPGFKGYYGTGNLVGPASAPALRILGDMTLFMLAQANANSGAIPWVLHGVPGGSGSTANFIYNLLVPTPGTLQWTQENNSRVSVAYAPADAFTCFIHNLMWIAVRRAGNVIQLWTYGRKLSAASSALAAPTDGSAGRLRVGGSQTQGAFDGGIAGLKICASALTDQQVTDEWNATLGGLHGAL